MWTRHLLRKVAPSLCLGRASQTADSASGCCRHLLSRPLFAATSHDQGLFLRPQQAASTATRGFATRSSADSYLVEVLKSEIEHELHEEAGKHQTRKSSTAPYELVDEPGTVEVLLKRTFGDEQISVRCYTEKQYDEDDEEEEGNEEEEGSGSDDGYVDVIHMHCNIKKGETKPAVEIHGSFVNGATEILVESVVYVNEDETEKSEKPLAQYEGPSFEELDENLQRAFLDIIKARGLTVKLAANMLDYLKSKEQREYMRWLHNMETFFS